MCSSEHFTAARKKTATTAWMGSEYTEEGKRDCGLLLTWLELAIEVPDVESQKGGQPHARATAALQIPSHQSSHEIVLVREQGWPTPYNELLMRCSNLQKVSLQNLPLETAIDFVSTCYYWYSVVNSHVSVSYQNTYFMSLTDSRNLEEETTTLCKLCFR